MKKILLLSAFLLSCLRLYAQTVSLALITAPCNNNGVLQATSSGISGTVTYTFYGGNTATLLATNTTGTLNSYTGGPIYVYASGSTTAVAFYNGAPPFTYTTTTTTASCPAVSTASVAITGGTSPFTVKWNLVGSTITAATGSTASLAPGSYQVHITDANGCTYGSYAKYDSIYVNNNSPVNFSITTTNASCTNGSAAVSGITGATAPYSYLWSNSANTASITGLVKGSYSVTVTDAVGCSRTNYTYVQQTPYISVNTTPTPATCLMTNGAAIAFAAGGTGPYSYYWSNTQTTQNATGLSGGNYYYITATDINGCTGNGGVYINSSTPITATYSATASSCTAATGTATVTASGGAAPYTYLWYTFPAQATATATGLASGTYNFKITDANGCIRTGAVYVPPVSIINANATASNASCTASNGTASVSVSSGATPFSYLWSTSATTSSISGLPAGGYSVKVTDNLGCSVTKYVGVSVNSPVFVNTSVTPASCIYSSNGSVTATAGGGTAPYSYNWGSSSGATISSLPTGGYYVGVTDANGCHGGAYSFVGYNAANTSCYCTITGTVYNDANNNCTKDPGEGGIPNVMMHCAPFGYAYTNAAGVYSFQVPTGTYTLSETVQAYYPLASCQSNSVSVSVTAATACTTVKDFANNTATIHDMRIQTVSFGGPPVPGNTYYQTVIAKNMGTVNETTILAGYKHDGQLGAPTSVPTALSLYSPAHYRNNTGFSTLSPAASQSFLMQYSVPTNIPISTSLLFKDSVVNAAPMSNWVNDYTPWNNVDAYYSSVAGSFDPNFKEVAPRGSGAAGNISILDSVLTYTIHFQNTGNWPAQKVVLRDTLSANLDPTTLRPIASNHVFGTTVSDGGGAVAFTFNNINLPDSASDPMGSIGYVIYTVKQKAGLAIGSQIKNRASIYFDYNAPVLTNTTTNTISAASQGVPGTTRTGDLAAILYPNPAGNNVNLLIPAAERSGNLKVRFVSLVGQVAMQQNLSLSAGRNTFELSTVTLAPGMYFVELSDGQRSSTVRLSIVK